ncbi:hypothetical protein HZ994_10895 [Akkermansiaceae bacterium]|nr:hypothetical protein HZ994_10895 [Akkermansiaceae bacterium]
MNRRNPLCLSASLLAFAILPLAAEVIPVDLPAPDGKPGTKDKPVKVFILSGQSNMLGFGKVEGSAPLYDSLFLSADPSVKACKMPVDNSALMPHGIYLSDAADAEKGARYFIRSGEEIHKDGKVALGTVSEKLPVTAAGQSLVVKAFIDVPYDGIYELHAGMGQACTIGLDGKEVKGGVALKAGTRYPLDIAYPQGGGSAAFWMEKTDMQGMGDLRWAIEKLGRFPYLLDEKGGWTVRNDVMLNDAYMGKGSSAPLSAPACGPTFGPELGFGYVMGTYLDEPVIVMKADIGNRSLGWDILPPDSESYTFEGKRYPGYGETVDADGNITKPGPNDWYAGKQYDDYTAAVRAVLDNFGERYPEYREQGFEVAGFAWWQGHKDGPNPAHNARYETNLANLIKAWRKEFNAPNAKWAIATVGFHGKDMPEHYVRIAEAQLAVADPKKHPEFAGNVATIDTRPFWRGPEVSPKNQDYHYNHNGETYMLTGDALGRAMVGLMGGKAQSPPATADKPIAAVPFMQPPSAEEAAAMASALSPIMLNRTIPDYVAKSAAIPAHQRRGMLLDNIASNTPPTDKKSLESLGSQLDQVIAYYNTAGIHDYDWKPFVPQMQKAEWNYLSFDPQEKVTKDAKGNLPDMYREVTLPAGSENWFAADFDPAQAGWKTGKAPFGQNNGEQKALRENCGVAHCGCDIAPATKWDNEVLLIRQTFDIPDFKEGHRYRIIVGGGGHAWAGEGFALYLNGKLLTEVKAAYYKGGGAARGAYVFEDVIPEFGDGKATLAVKAFLRQTGHRGKPGPPNGHLSVWMQEAKLPPAVLEMAAKPTE